MSVVTEALRQIDWTDKQVLVACSGGVDSMVLLHELVRIGVRPEVLHVNYNLRGADSDADQQLVEASAARFGLRMHARSCAPESLKRTGTNLQAAARTFRHRFFTEWTQRSEHHVVALGHHADDQFETFFLQLLRGSGTFGLGGMHPERDRLVRPFLGLSKQQLYDHATQTGVTWREDQSNGTTDYRRNLLRNVVLPSLLNGHPDLKENTLFLMQQFRNRQMALKQTMSAPVNLWKQKGVIAVTGWSSWDAEERIAFLHETGLPFWAAGRLQQLADADSGAHFMIGDTRIERTGMLLVRIRATGEVPGWDFKIEEVGILPEVFDKQTIYLDREKLHGELRSRLPQTGDRIKSLGVQGSQLVSDVLKDAGIPRSERAGIPLLTDGEEILWIPGIKIGRTAIARPGSLRMLKVTLRAI